MAEPVYPSLEQQQEGGPKIGFEGLEGAQESEGGFSVQFTPSGADSKEQLTDEPQPTYRTFEGEQPPQASSEEINLLAREERSKEDKVIKNTEQLHTYMYM